MVKYFPYVGNRVVGHRLHRKSFSRYELRDVYLSDVVEDVVESNFSSKVFELEGVPKGLIKLLEHEVADSNMNLEETLGQIKDFREDNGYVCNNLRRKRLKYELKEQIYKNALSALNE